MKKQTIQPLLKTEELYAKPPGTFYLTQHKDTPLSGQKGF